MRTGSDAAAITSGPGQDPETDVAPAPGRGAIAPGFPVVGVGASAGGLAAFGRLLRALPKTSGMAYVLVQHLSPEHDSRLAQLLGKDSPLPVHEAREGDALLPDHVYVIPPNADMSLLDGQLRIAPRGGGRGLHLSIDLFLRSLARELGSRAIGIVLSGSGADGTVGLAEIKSAGGITFVQDPRSAESAEMPTSAINHGHADFILTPEEMGRELARMSEHGYLRGSGPATGIEGDAEDADSIAAVVTLLTAASEVDFALYRASTIRRRALRRMALRGVPSLAAYVGMLRAEPQEVMKLLKDVLITVTSFFRDPEVFAAIRSQVLPKLTADHAADQPVRAWVVACSTGQEAYSVAMELIEHFDSRRAHPPIQIFATDISEDSLAIARNGVYPASIEAEVSGERLRRHFTRVGEGYRINKSIRDLCVFARHDITADTPFSKMDLITCRNVLIYLTPALQARVIPTFHYTLNAGGFLVLGGSESVGRASELFDAVDAKSRIYRKHATRLRVHQPTTPGPRRPASTGGPVTRPPSLADLQRAADRIVLGRYAPSGVLVDEHLDIIQFRGQTRAFLEPAQGEASLNLLKMVPYSLGQELLGAIEEARAQELTIRRKGVRVREDHHLRELDFEVSLVRLPGSAAASVLILFEEAKPSEPPAQGGDGSASSPAPSDYLRLQQELASANDYLQSLTEENNAVNDELRFANDEATSANEELRCTNEELQTAKEEVESANEELVTLNEELRQRNQELTLLSDDLANLVDATELPIVMLGRDLRVRRVTQPAERMLRLTPLAVGQRIGGGDLGFTDLDLEKLAEQVMATRQAGAVEVRDRDGRWFSLRLTPYRVEGDGVDGTVLTCIDIDASKRTQEILRRSGDFTKSVIETVPDPVLVLDAELRVHTVNRAFQQLFELAPEAVIGQQIYRIAGGDWDVPELRRLLEAVVHGLTAMDHFELTHDFARIGRRSMLLSARQMEPVGDSPRMLVLAASDVTAQKRMNDELRMASVELQRSNAELEQFASVASHDLQEPLRMITSYTTLLQRSLGDRLDDRAREYVGFVNDGAKRMSDLIKAILAYARVGSQGVSLREVDAGAIAREALFNLERRIADTGAVIECGTLPTMRADPVLLTQLLQNLISNAIKFRAKDRTPRVALTAHENEREWIIAVADNGIGIAPEDTERIFTLFQRVHAASEYPGTGIGLATCKKIVERHHGRLWVESALGSGTTFSFSLPKPGH